MKCWLSKLLLLGVGLLTSQFVLADWSLMQAAGEDRYRSVTVRMEGLNLTDADSIQLLVMGEDGEQVLHSRWRVVSDLEHNLLASDIRSFDPCLIDGEEAAVDEAGTLLIGRDATTANCVLNGLLPDTTYTLTVEQADRGGSIKTVGTLAGLISREKDTRPAPLDIRPVSYALGSIILSVMVLFAYFHYRDRGVIQQKARLAHFYVLPAILGLAALVVYPILYGVFLSFTDADQRHLGEQDWVGLSNYLTLVTAPGVARVFGFTLVWVVANVIFHMLCGLILASLLASNQLAGTRVYRSLLLLPWAVPAYISVLAWSGMLQVDGLINLLLGTRFDFLVDPTAARLSVILVNIWLGIPFMMVMLVSAMQSIPRDMYAAAELDGVSRFRQFVSLTLPALKNAIVPLMLLDFIWSFNMFNTIYLLTRGSPFIAFGEPGATDILVTYIFEVAFESGHYGIAAAWSVAIFLGLVAFSFAYAKQTRVIDGVQR